MRCREFEQELSEWVRGRLSTNAAAAMQEHRSACPRCDTLAKAERQLQQQMRGLRVPELKRDLWPELATRIEQPAQRLHAGRRPSVLRWVLAGTLAAVVGFASFRAVLQPSSQRLAGADAEARVVRMMADLEPVRYVDADLSGFDVYRSHEVQKAVLMGSEGASR